MEEGEQEEKQWKVRIYLYDISKGVAKHLAPALIGRTLEGIWHTSVVVYGKEFLYTTAGLVYTLKGESAAGTPDEIVVTGRTKTNQKEFKKYLRKLAEEKYKGDQYHLLRHNCNVFSNEASIFLTGTGVPEKVASLSDDILSTPMGKVIGPLLHHAIARIEGPGVINVAEKFDNVREKASQNRDRTKALIKRGGNAIKRSGSKLKDKLKLRHREKEPLDTDESPNSAFGLNRRATQSDPARKTRKSDKLKTPKQKKTDRPDALETKSDQVKASKQKKLDQAKALETKSDQPNHKKWKSEKLKTAPTQESEPVAPKSPPLKRSSSGPPFDFREK